MAAGTRMTCPKCGGEMKPGSVAKDFRILKEGDMYGDNARVFYCIKCGFVELYKEPSTKETWRWQRPPTESEKVQPMEEPSQPEKEETERRPVKRLVR